MATSYREYGAVAVEPVKVVGKALLGKLHEEPLADELLAAGVVEGEEELAVLPQMVADVPHAAEEVVPHGGAPAGGHAQATAAAADAQRAVQHVLLKMSQQLTLNCLACQIRYVWLKFLILN